MAFQFDLIDLQLFLHIAEAGSITAGAARAHTALASASARVRGMEASLGLPLLVRGRQGVALTPAGQTLLEYARLILRQAEELRGALGAHVQGAKGRIRLMCNTAALAELVAEGLSGFLSANPDVDVDLEERLSHEITQAVAEGAADIGIVSSSADLSGLETFDFGTVRMLLVVADYHPLAAQASVRFADALHYDFVGMGEGSALEAFLQNLAAQAGRRINYRVRLGSFDAVCRMVERGVGVAIVPAAAALRSQPGLGIRLIELQDPWAFRDLRICVRRYAEMPAYARRLIEAIKS